MSSFGGSGGGGVEAPIINPSSIRLPPVVRQEEQSDSDCDDESDDDDDRIVPAPQSWFTSYDDDDEQDDDDEHIMEDKKEEEENNNIGRRNSYVVQRQESIDTPPLLSLRGGGREQEDGEDGVTLFEDVRTGTPRGEQEENTAGISSSLFEDVRTTPGTPSSCDDDDELFSSTAEKKNKGHQRQHQQQQQQQQQQRSKNNNNNSHVIIPQNRQQLQQRQPKKKKKHENTSPSTNAANTKIAIGSPLPSPSWKEISSRILPQAASELLSSSMHRICYSARLSYYERARKYRAYSELGNNMAIGYYRNSSNTNTDGTEGEEESKSKSKLIAALPELPPFSSLPWVERQLVQEWRTYRPEEYDDVVVKDNDTGSAVDHDHDEEDEFDLARHLVPNPIPRPTWQKSENCFECNKPFGPTRLRHHCRLCGQSYCQPHSAYSHKLPHLGYHPDVPERVCDTCKHMLLEQNLAERVAWRLARCRDYCCCNKTEDDGDENGCNGSQLTPYFETGVDTVEDAALRVTKAALEIARSIPLGAQATIAVETVDVLRQHGLNGIYTIMLRQEFLAAADVLRKALGINRTAWPLSVHELSAAIFYALAQHRAMRGMKPEREHLIHSFRTTTSVAAVTTTTTTTNDSQPQQQLQKPSPNPNNSVVVDSERNVDDAAIYKIEETADVSDLVSNGNGTRPKEEETSGSTDGNSPTTTSSSTKPNEPLPFQPVCDPVPDSTLNLLLLYAPLALTFIYAEKEVDMQLLAAQQGWRLLYAYLDQETGKKITDRPASAFFVHEEQNVACIAVRGTSTINDIVTDIRQVPVPFPENDDQNKADADEDWTTVFRGNGLAVCGMAVAAVNLYREHIDSILFFARHGYRIRITGHSLGGGVGTLLGALVYRDLERESLIGSWDEATSSEADAPLRVYTYGTPSCVDARLAENVAPFVTTVVLHDDVVPRLTPASCRGLLKHLLNIKETWMKEFLPDDIMAITERAKLVWAPRWRGSFTLSKSSSSIKRYCRKQIQYGKKQLLSVKDKLVGEECVDPTGCFGGGSTLERIDERSEDLKIEDTSTEPSGDTKADSENNLEPEKEQMADGDTEEIRLFPDYMGGIDCRTEGMVIDGDEFFDTEENLLEGSDDDESDDGCELNKSMYQSTYREPAAAVEGCRDQPVGDASAVPATANEEGDSDFESPGAVVLEETPLPRMFIPGKVVHIYSHRGVYRAAYVPRTFKELRRITLQGNMLSDHRTKSYYEALLEVRSVRNAAESPPKWSAFDEDVTCSCCAAVFTWASTSDSEAQEARDKHNCRSCGTLVCHPCSTNMIPVPSIGLTVPGRVCDRCYNDIGGMLTRPGRQENTFAPGNDSSPTSKSASSTTLEDKPERQRERRSAVVDELASRVQASSLTS